MASTDNYLVVPDSTPQNEWTEDDVVTALNSMNTNACVPLPPLNEEDWWLHVPRWRPDVRRRRSRVQTLPWTVAATALIKGIFTRLLLTARIGHSHRGIRQATNASRSYEDGAISTTASQLPPL